MRARGISYLGCVIVFIVAAAAAVFATAAIAAAAAAARARIATQIALPTLSHHSAAPGTRERRLRQMPLHLESIFISHDVDVNLALLNSRGAGHVCFRAKA